ncbi:Outer membrane protein (porin) [Succinivibrio dextrinosolvens DSM 3072]|uniref:Outer membrane protein (Porin) n=1 Tax=Succinivibrio dextrinosolvens DSM 3072 TaxID=1123324 RepID=A0A1T4V6Y4_9GAMM|nr:porin [Succinivibrio dextrinosolvens]SKA60677.1 Outer membrane protein (porin) [Succinivibrio dextrinosolvens DSM 3072]
MKKSLLALAVVAVAASANAATVYDKDGTSLVAGGRVQSVFYNGNHTGHNAAENDSSIQNSARFSLAGKTQVTDWVSGLGYAEWDMDNKGTGDGTTARDQYVGADFGEFGLVKAGRFVDSAYYAEEVTDHYEDAAGTVQGKFNGERRGGQLVYIYDNYGFHAQAGLQTAQDKASLVNAAKTGLEVDEDAWAIDSGFNGALGYTFDDVVFGPLSIRAGYSYVKGQNDGDIANAESGTPFENMKHVTAGISWGNLNSGFYCAALYEYAKLKFDEQRAFSVVDPDSLEAVDFEQARNKGFELAVGYAFDNGVSALVGYESSHVKITEFGGESGTYKIKRIPVFVNYKLNSNFNVWTEAGFNAGSDHDLGKNVDRTVWSVGARYTF